MSRIDSVEVALMKCGIHDHDVKGAVVASDAFFPFTDSLEKLASRGVKAVVVPGGARRDDQVVEAASNLDMTLLFVEDRHFRH